MFLKSIYWIQSVLARVCHDACLPAVPIPVPQSRHRLAAAQAVPLPGKEKASLYPSVLSGLSDCQGVPSTPGAEGKCCAAPCVPLAGALGGSVAVLDLMSALSSTYTISVQTQGQQGDTTAWCACPLTAWPQKSNTRADSPA